MLSKKAEAAQRRRMQVEKATKESEAEAIRKILGLDSDKKKEERKQKEREEKERAARGRNLTASTIRWVMGPTQHLQLKTLQLPSPTGEMRWPVMHERVPAQGLQAEAPSLQLEVLQSHPRERLKGQLWKSAKLLFTHSHSGSCIIEIRQDD